MAFVKLKPGNLIEGPNLPGRALMYEMRVIRQLIADE
jgi:hypothetical protein